MWRKSSRSNENTETNCVEVSLKGSSFRVRDSKNKTAVVITSGWSAFLLAVKNGDLDQPVTER